MFGAHRLPGIAFETVRAAAPEALPRMDVALFAGFAAMGPVHRPVPVEDFEAFRRLFGDDCPLAFDADRGRVITAALAPCVRAFFANGGQRCWVVRIARTAALQALLLSPSENGIAAAGRFDIEPFVALGRDGTVRPGRAQARSLGSWSDDITVAARVERSPFVCHDLVAAGFARTSLVGGDHDVSFDQVEFNSSARLTAGDLLQFDDALGTIYAAVERIDGARAWASLIAEVRPTSPPELSPPEVSAIESSPPQPLGAGARLPQTDARTSRVTLGLRVDHGTERTVISGVGLTRLHANSWWNFLPDDLRPNGAGEPTLLIAADEAEIDPEQAPLAWLPWLPTSDGLFSDAIRAEHDGRSSLGRDGLSRFDAQLFLDPALAQVGSDRLMEEAERILHLEQRQLFGIHSVLGIGGASEFNPVSLLSLPDAGQPGWVERDLREAPDPDSTFSPPAHWFDHRGPCAKIPANAKGRRDPDRSRFLDCSMRVLSAPEFEPINRVRKPEPVELRWTDAEPGAEYVLEMARSSTFVDAEVVHDGPATSCIVTLASEGFYFFRLRARLDDEISQPAVIALTVTLSEWVAAAADEFQSSTLLEVQRALLRLASATGEMFALLSLPRHYRIAEAVRHVRELRTLGGAFGKNGQLGWNERRALSFGAIHHPWILSPNSNRGLTAAPPEGAIAGVHARRTLERGAWIAAANERLRDVVAIDTAIPDPDWAQADENRINLLRRDPRGFLLLDSDTLSDEPAWQQINVRRLMSLLRRIALRRGATYVFESHGDVLRRSVERGFTELLDRLFSLGAFAGRKPEEAYRLAVASTAQDRDAGRLVVEIGVAPAQPLRFLTVRLVQSGGRFAVAEED